MQKTEINSITIVATEPTEVDGLSLPAGEYPAYRKRIGLPMMGGQIKWTTPQYMIELSESQLRRLGVKESIVSMEVDATQAVASGALKVF